MTAKARQNLSKKGFVAALLDPDLDALVEYSTKLAHSLIVMSVFLFIAQHAESQTVKNIAGCILVLILIPFSFKYVIDLMEFSFSILKGLLLLSEIKFKNQRLYFALNWGTRGLALTFALIAWFYTIKFSGLVVQELSKACH